MEMLSFRLLYLWPLLEFIWNELKQLLFLYHSLAYLGW
jgi:hypothetical protein